MNKIFYIAALSLLFPILSRAQAPTYTADELFTKARQAAFDSKDYPSAIAISKQALQQAPTYTDIHIFLGRLYTWSDQIDSARVVFESLKLRDVKDEDFYMAYGYMLYWNDLLPEAEALLKEGVAQHPQSEDLWLLKGKILYSQKSYAQAEQAVDALLALNPRHTEAYALAKNIREYSAKNAFGVSYDFTHFDKQFADNWHIVGLSYKRATPLGSVILKANMARKFADNGTQLELEAYPRINKTFYLYVGAGYSQDVGLFPKYRTGVSLYANLPHSFEGEIGYRQLHFSESLWMYTASVGKYYSNFWFNLRTYLSAADTDISHSYTGTVRYYMNGAHNYLSFQAGTGISPEENRSNLLDIDTFKLKTFKVGAAYNFKVLSNNFINLSATYFNQEYRPLEKGNQYDLSISYSRVF